jgi:hypothetical protein
VRVLLGFVPAVACIGGMLLCMRMMSGGHGRKETSDADRQSNARAASSDHEIAELRDEVNRLRDELRTREGRPEHTPTP